MDTTVREEQNPKPELCLRAPCIEYALHKVQCTFHSAQAHNHCNWHLSASRCHLMFPRICIPSISTYSAPAMQNNQSNDFEFWCLWHQPAPDCRAELVWEPTTKPLIVLVVNLSWPDWLLYLLQPFHKKWPSYKIQHALACLSGRNSRNPWNPSGPIANRSG